MNILVYAGRGVSPECLHHTLRSLRIISGAFYDIKTVSSECLAGEPWEEGCSLLVFPGGRDLPFVEDLQDRATSRIQRYVLERGGKYFGICAGAYFACARVEFERGTALEVIGERDLALCAATAVGCVYPGFEYGGDGGVHAASIRLADAGQRLAVYYNGGCYFDFARDHAETRWPVRFETAAVYADKGDKPAIVVGVQPGQSDASVILTGVHIEYDPAEIECMKPSLPILGELKNSAAERARLWRWVLGRFGLMTSEAQGASRGQPASGLPSPSPTPLFMFFASREQRKKLVAALEGSESYCAGRFESETQTFVVHRDPPCALEELKVTEKECPLVLHSSLPAVQDPSWTFSPETYYSCLEGRAGIGQHLIYAEYVFSTQTFALQYAGPLRCWVTCAFRNSKLTSILPSGTVILAGDQLAGKGRGHNTWLSSKGCLQFTMLLHHQDDPATKLDLALIQYLVGLAVVETIVGEPDYEVSLLGACGCLMALESAGAAEMAQRRIHCGGGRGRAEEAVRDPGKLAERAGRLPAADRGRDQHLRHPVDAIAERVRRVA